MNRRFAVGDIVYPVKDVERFGNIENRLFEVVSVGETSNNVPFMNIRARKFPKEEPWASYELGWEKFTPSVPTEAGAEEYDYIMEIQEMTSRGDR